MSVRLDPRAVPKAYSPADHAGMIADAALSLSLPHVHADGAHALCGDTCLGYHRGWMLLQHLGLISGLASERGYIAESIRELDRRRPLDRVLIAGSADFGLLSVLHEALGDGIGRTTIVVADRCDTPLDLCLRYAGEMGFQVRVERRDLLDDPVPGAFDLVMMHSLLSFCPPERRSALLAALGAPLAPGGTLLAYQSIRPSPSPVVLAYSDEEVASLVGRARDAQAGPGAAVGLPADLVEAHVRAFCRAKTTVSVESVESVSAAIDKAGLVQTDCRLMLDSAHSRHKAATPRSHFLKYEFRAARSV